MSNGKANTGYQLLDCGNGRRLENFAGVVVNRPAPAVCSPPAWSEAEWAKADLAYRREGGWQGSAPGDWQIEMGAAILNLRPGAGGQIGVFPEHTLVISQLEKLLSRPPAPPGGWRVLNLFAHTGLATLRLAALPDVNEIVHLDAAPAVVFLARENAVASGLADSRIRWIVDDALAFLAKETRRGRDYHLILADPPAFGRNRKSGKEWKLERDLPELLALSRALANHRMFSFCLTCHKPGWDGKRLAGLFREAFPELDRVKAERLSLRPQSGGRELPCGCAAIASTF